MKLLTTSNYKTLKGEKQGVMTAIMHLAPCKLSGYQVCPWATKGCKAACLNTAGRGAFNTVQTARINRTKLLFEHTETFYAQLYKEIRAFIRKAKRNDMTPAIRLNGTSDLYFVPVIRQYPNAQFYDYTKAPEPPLNMPDNYHLTYSLNESGLSREIAQWYLDSGFNVAVVFRSELPTTWLGVPVVNGDTNDIRFHDKRGVVVGLLAKGKAKQDKTGFVVDYTCTTT